MIQNQVICVGVVRCCGFVACCRCKMPYLPFCEQIFKKKLKVIKKDKSLCSAEDVFNI